MNLLEKLKPYLRELNYPGINIMQDNEVADIFSKKNRLYFSTWFLEQWHGILELPMDEKDKANMLANILCDNGFCTSEKSIKFVEGDLTLEPNEQLEIIYRMLYNLCILKSSQESCDKHNISVTEGVISLSKLDVNIFPQFGPMQSRKPKERIQKLKELKGEMEELQREINCCNIQNYDEQNLCISNKDSESLIKEVSVLISNSSFLLKERQKQNKGSFSPNFETIIADCHQRLSDVLKLYENKRAIRDFCVDSLCPQENDRIDDIIKRVSILSQEILLID